MKQCCQASSGSPVSRVNTPTNKCGARLSQEILLCRPGGYDEGDIWIATHGSIYIVPFPKSISADLTKPLC